MFRNECKMNASEQASLTTVLHMWSALKRKLRRVISNKICQYFSFLYFTKNCANSWYWKFKYSLITFKHEIWFVFAISSPCTRQTKTPPLKLIPSNLSTSQIIHLMLFCSFFYCLSWLLAIRTQLIINFWILILRANLFIINLIVIFKRTGLRWFLL